MYLQLDGVDDYLEIPLLEHDKVVIEISILEPFESRDVVFQNDRGMLFNFGWQNGMPGYYADSSNRIYQNDEWMRTVSNLIINEDILLEINHQQMSSSTTIGYGVDAGNPYYSKVNLYKISVYNNDTLVAHYNLSTGTVQDQSGNGNHATLYGGTWVNDGDSGTDVSFTYQTEQQLFSNLQQDYSTQQSLYTNRLMNAELYNQIYAKEQSKYDTQQTLFSNRITNLDTEQSIYENQTTLHDILLEFYLEGMKKSYTYDTLQQLFESQQTSFDTSQVIYNSIKNNFQTHIMQYANTSESYSIEQQIYQVVTTLYDTLIQIFDSGIIRSYNYPMNLSIYQDKQFIYNTEINHFKRDSSVFNLRQALYHVTESKSDIHLVINAERIDNYDTIQSIFDEVSVAYPTTQNIFDPQYELIGAIRLKGERNLYVHLQTKNEITVRMKGNRELYIRTKGEIT